MLDKPYVIHHRRPYRCLILILLAMTLTVVGIGYWGQQWRAQQTEKFSDLQARHQQLLTESQQLTEKNQSLMAQLEGINQMQAMQQATDSQLQSDLETLQNKLIQLNKELMFYQNITQGNVSSELQVRELHLRSSNEDSTLFHYRIVLTQGKKTSKAITGKVALTLNSVNGDMKRSRVVNEQALKIRHVQVLEGTMKLTENEQPISLDVMLKQGKKTLAERTFEWDPSP